MFASSPWLDCFQFTIYEQAIYDEWKKLCVRSSIFIGIGIQREDTIAPSHKTSRPLRVASTLSKKYFSCSSMGVRQNPWIPTKRRGPIAAEAASPGPAVVSLPSLIGKPSPESRKPRAPAFTFGQKLEPSGKANAGPGPASYNTEGMTSKGRAAGPAASLHGRWPPPRVAHTPAPCDYEPSKSARAVLDHAPAFSIGLRVSLPQPGSQSPAPNIYSMPPVLGEAKEGNKRAAPAFSITGRGKTIECKTPMPGPGTYTTDKATSALNRRPPSYTMAPRREVKSSSASVPGPGVYCPEKADAVLHEKSPKYSLSGKGKIEKIEHVPAPNAYNPEKADRILREKSPAYTFRTKTEVIKVHDAPAPNVYSPEKSLHVLKSGPKYTLAGKGAAEKHELTPAPNSYNPQKADKILHESSPAYTIRSKEVVEKIEQTPAPNVYAPEKSIDMLNGGPKFSMSGKNEITKINETPAPNCYNPDKADKLLHESSPSYSFRKKDQIKKVDNTPAPNAYAPENFLSTHESSPKFTMGGKGHSPKVDYVPAPNSYSLDKVDKLLYDSTPAYTFRSKPSADKPNDTPGPNVYDPHLLDGTPKFSLYGKGSEVKPVDTPGPNAYDPHLLDGSPKYTMAGRSPLKKPSDVPAPNAYNPHLPEDSPKFSFTGRTPDGKLLETPGPNTYDPHMPNDSPKFTISGKGVDVKLSDTPGPNTYDPHLSSSGPKFTMCGKGHPDKIYNSPAPNAYSPEKANNMIFEHSPSYTFSSKHPLTRFLNTPAPNTYDPSKYIHMLDGVPKYSFGLKGPAEKPSTNPAPNAYCPEKADRVLHENSPSYSFRPKIENNKINNTPAPNFYNPEKADKILLDNAPRYSFRIKTNPHKADNIPAPNAYNPDKADKVMMQSAPQYTFRIKSDTLKAIDTPAPNSYNIPSPVKTPLYTISGRHKEPINERLKVPSPGTYNPEKGYKFVLTYSPQYTFGIKIHTDKYTKSPAPNAYRIPSVLDTPVYTFSGRHKVPVDDRSQVPAPGTYSPEKVQLNKTPQITFGIKHSPLLGQLKPIKPIQSIENETIKKTAIRDGPPKQRNVSSTSRQDNEVIVQTNNLNDNLTKQDTTQICNDDLNQSSIDVHNKRTHATHLRSSSDVRSTTATPELVQETLTQEIVWIPEKPIRRGSYTIDTSDGTGFKERYEINETVPVRDGIMYLRESGERGGSNESDHSREILESDEYKQVTDRNVTNASAFEKKQENTKEVYTDTNIKELPNGGISTTTTTKTVRKVGTNAKTANATTNLTRTNVTVTSRDVGTK
ncbi:unnamed protein product [Parnassius apollo]|uniref:(apollo) hypothetical protein n=1 Tax=Parnassius apollo TaxID=110799 RepID=A0A8S3Y5J0_PARAO|nr:unnamed protein product [Parnassius apollo]